MLRGFYFITDASLSRAGIISDVREACRAGACAIQYRSKYISTKLMIKEAMKLRKICRKELFVINDRIDIVQAVKADGVHLGQSDMPVSLTRKILGKDKIIGLTVHSMAQAEEAVSCGVDYLGVAPVFATNTKLDAGKPVGLALITKIRKKYKIPIVAIGGINIVNARDVIKAGADSLCAISAVVGKSNIKAEISRFLEEINIGLAS
ncbi:MAG: thiamine phosphate synthase [Candidatus Omnitrophota bacterium]|jgi:thiamine-phosphate pyrophosphorylase